MFYVKCRHGIASKTKKKYQASWTNETILQQTYVMIMSGI